MSVIPSINVSIFKE